MASGVKVDGEVIDAFNAAKKSKCAQYLLFKLNEEKTTIIFDTQVDKPEDERDTYCEQKIKDNWKCFVSGLPAKDCRYAIYDFNYELDDGGRRDKLVFVVWCPDVAVVKEKMVYASSKGALKKALVGVNIEIQANDEGDLEFGTVKEKLSKKGTA